MIALDINISQDNIPVVGTGTAFYRFDKQTKEFFEKCLEKHEILGFDWKAEDPWNFGLILKEKTNESK